MEAFPPIEADSAPYRGPKKEYITTKKLPCIVHHRMGFYTASNDRLLVTTFYGLSPDFHMAPNNGYGVGRAVREIYKDRSISPICFLRYNETGGYRQENARQFPSFKDSRDLEFIKACEELLKNRLVTQQWWEEERLDESYFTRPDGRALSYYTLPSGRVMAVFKDSFTSWSDDCGEHWSPIKKSCSIETANGKVWGQKTPDGRYALVYNPSPDGAHRWPLAMVSGENGVDFDELTAVVLEISPCRYEGQLKNLGAQYVRGITEANQKPEDMAMWLVYSVNKEDMWVARVPVPAKSVWDTDVEEELSQLPEKQFRDTWNLYVPSWNQAEQTEEGLYMTDRDPYNRTRAMRMLKPGRKVEITAVFQVKAVYGEPVSVLVQDRHGQTITCVLCREDETLWVHQGGTGTYLCRYRPDQDIELVFLIDTVENEMRIETACGEERGQVVGYTAVSAEQVERILFTTKYTLPFQNLEINGKNGDIGNLPGADEKIPETIVVIKRLNSKTLEE